jgi:NAD(P)-dependent dehydrogenase (short-subunit alcohol dehydrogenase family)
MPLVVMSAAGTNGDGHGARFAFDDNGKRLGPFTRDPRIADPRGLAVDHTDGLPFINNATGIAPVAVFLASDGARWLTGETLFVSGGL